MSTQETTAALSQDESLEQTAASNPEDSTQPNQPDAQEAQSDDSIPEKFRGKSAMDVIHSYRELEKQIGKISSERSLKEKEAKELQERLAQQEQRLNEVYSQLSQRQSTQVQDQQPDPFTWFDEEFDNNPKEAIKRTLQRIPTQLEMQNRAREAAEFYSTQKTGNQDFAALETDMQDIARRYGHMLRPEHANSKETIQLMYDLARAKNMDKYVKSAVEKAKSSGELVREEKRKAYSEGTSASAGDKSVRFDDLSLAEMAKALGRADD